MERREGRRKWRSGGAQQYSQPPVFLLEKHKYGVARTSRSFLIVRLCCYAAYASKVSVPNTLGLSNCTIVCDVIVRALDVRSESKLSKHFPETCAQNLVDDSSVLCDAKDDDGGLTNEVNMRTLHKRTSA